MMNGKWQKIKDFRLWLLSLSLLIFVFSLYSSALNAPFVLDDYNNIVDNAKIRISSLSWQGLRDVAFNSPAKHRPVANVSFALDYLIHKSNLIGFHITNVLIHYLNGILLFFWARATLNLPAMKKRYGPSGWTPFVAALLWVINPLHIDSVTYVVQRMNSLAVMFYLLSFLLYIHGRLGGGNKRRLLFAGSLLAGLLSFGCKEMTVVLPVFILLYEAYFFQDLRLKADRRILLGVAAALGVIMAMTWWLLGKHPVDVLMAGYERRPFTLEQRLLTEPRVVLFYLSLLFFPHPSRLTLLHDFPLSYSLFNPATTLLSLVVIGGLLFFAVYYARREPVVSFCIIWYFGNILIESSFPALEIIFEHRAYMPSMMVVFLAVFLVERFVRIRYLQYGALALIIIFSSRWTYSCNAIWADDVLHWRDAAAKFPESPRTLTELGNSLFVRKKYDEALVQYKEAIRIWPQNRIAYNNIGVILAEEGRTNEAIAYYRKALAIDPGAASTHFHLARALTAQGRLEEAYEHCSEAVRLKPGNVEANKYLLGILQMMRLRRAANSR